KKLRYALGDDADNPIFIETIPRRGYRFIATVRPVTVDFADRSGSVPVENPSTKEDARRVTSARPVNIQSLAVLPLENLSGDSSQDYFADGMTDELITNLGQISSLRVISRTSVMQYRGVHKPLPQIARELNVDAVVEGTVVRSGGQVRIAAQLIQAST